MPERRGQKKTEWRKATKKVWLTAQMYYQGTELPKILKDQDTVTLTEWEIACERLLDAIDAEKGRRTGDDNYPHKGMSDEGR